MLQIQSLPSNPPQVVCEHLHHWIENSQKWLWLNFEGGLEHIMWFRKINKCDKSYIWALWVIPSPEIFGGSSLPPLETRIHTKTHLWCFPDGIRPETPWGQGLCSLLLQQSLRPLLSLNSSRFPSFWVRAVEAMLGARGCTRPSGWNRSWLFSSTWIYLRSGKVASRRQFLPRQHLAMSRDILGRKGAVGIWWAEARDATEHLIKPGTANPSPIK